MGKRRACATALMLAPLAVGIPAPGPDSSATRFGISGGGASFLNVVRGCENQVLQKQRLAAGDLRAEVDLPLYGPLRIGVRGGAIWDDRYPDQVNPHVNPHAALEFRRFGLGAGWVAWRHQPRDVPDVEMTLPAVGKLGNDAGAEVSAHVRIGPSNGKHVLASWVEGPSLVADGYGVLQARSTLTWGRLGVGLSVGGLYDNPGFLVSYARELGAGVEIHASGRAGVAARSGEFGVRSACDTRGGTERTPAPAHVDWR